MSRPSSATWKSLLPAQHTRVVRAWANTQPGDGKRYKGRGPIQLTGRANYTKYGDLLGLDLVNNPTIAAAKEVGFRIAGQFWKLNGLNELADQQQFKSITKASTAGTTAWTTASNIMNAPRKL